MKIPLTKPHFDNEDIEILKETLDSGWVAGQGPKSIELGQLFSEKIGVKYSIPVNNCTAALHLSLLVNNISSGDEVIVSDYTFPATGHSVLYTGATPRFVDIEKDTFNLDPNKIESLINDKTKAIIPVHAFGQPADLDAIKKIANENNLIIIEDAACAAGAKYKNRYIGSHGNITCYSFHARKNITTGEGGMITTDDSSIATRLKSLSNFGMESAYNRQQSDDVIIPTFTQLGYNYKLSDLASALGITQLKKMDKIIESKRKVAKLYKENLQNIEEITLRNEPDFAYSVYQAFVVLVPSFKIRNKIISEMKKFDIGMQIGTYSSYIQPVYQTSDKCPNSFDVFNRALALPFYDTMKENEVLEVTEKLRRILK